VDVERCTALQQADTSSAIRTAIPSRWGQHGDVVRSTAHLTIRERVTGGSNN
jgi:hypothetical protein